MTIFQTGSRSCAGPASTAPAGVGRQAIRGVFLPGFDEDRPELLNNVMHWGYGTGWGVAYALTEGVTAPVVPRGWRWNRGVGRKCA
jgi:hypothetical protein